MPERLEEERTAQINRTRGLQAEFGLVFVRSPEVLRAAFADLDEEAGEQLPGVVRLALRRAHLRWLDIELQMSWYDERITAHVRNDELAKKAATLLGIGPIKASALVATVSAFVQFANARQFGAWLGLVPSQNSTGGKASLGRITKRGDDYLRTLLIQGAKSAVMTAGKRTDRISHWLVQLKQRAGWQKAVVALANKNARITWAVLTRDAAFDPNRVPEAPSVYSQVVNRGERGVRSPFSDIGERALRLAACCNVRGVFDPRELSTNFKTVS